MKTVLLLILTAVISYCLGCVSGSMVLSTYVFRNNSAKHGRMESPLSEFFHDFGPIGAAMLVLFDLAKTMLAVLIGGALLSLVDQMTVGRLFAAFCLSLGHAYPLLFLFRGGKAMLCAGIAVFMIDWRVGLCCWVAYVVVVIFTRYTALGAVASAALAAIFMWLFDFTGLEGMLALLCAGIIVLRHAENLLRIAGGTEPRSFDFSMLSKKGGNAEESLSEEDEDDYY